MSYIVNAVDEIVTDVWEDIDGSTTYSSKKEEVEVHFESYKDYIKKIIIRVLREFYNGYKQGFNEETAFNLIYDFDEVEEAIEKEFAYDINELLLQYYRKQQKEEE